jgi:riboflavin transporter FmnP
MAYKIGLYTGKIINFIVYALFVFDGYNNVRDHRSFAIDIIGINLALFAKDVAAKLFHLYQASEFIAMQFFQEQTRQNKIDEAFENITKDL